MPPRRAATTVTRRRRRTTRRRTTRRRKNRDTLVNPSRSLLPNRFHTKLVYSDFFTQTTPGSGLIAWKQFAMNGLFDPDITGFGHQPMGFDQLCPTLYQSYVVTGCKMILEGRFMSNNLDTNPVTGNIIIGGVTPLLTALPGDIGMANEARQYITITRGDQTPFRVTKYFSVGKTAGISLSRVKSEVNYTGSNTFNPPYTALINVGFVNMESSVAIKISYSVTLVYYVQFFGPTTLGQS